MSIRYTGMFVSSIAAVDTVVFSTKASQLAGIPFVINAVKIGFNTKALNISTSTFTIVKGVLNIDNGFMAF